MKHIFIDKQSACNYQGGSYLYEIAPMNKREQLAFFEKILNLNNLDVDKIKIDYFEDGIIKTDVSYRKRLSKNILDEKYSDKNIEIMKVKGIKDGFRLSVSCHYKKNTVMIKTDLLDEKKYKILLKEIF